MPSFYSGLPPQRLPPTPPETYGQYIDSGYGSTQLHASQVISVGKQPSANYYASQPGHVDTIPQRAPQFLPVPIMRQPLFPETGRHHATSYVASQQTEPVRQAPISAPQLPPLRMPNIPKDVYNHNGHLKPSQTQPKVKEEKIGGVAAQLDYEMDEMVDFVSEMTCRMYDLFTTTICLADIDMARSVLNYTSAPSRDFRKYVLQVLSSTRLPSSTILLGLLYLSKRMEYLSTYRSLKQSSQEMYSMLIIALVLGSKFLDDNTFQNRSWAEVSSIHITDINRMEFEWLSDIKWDMHIDQEDPEGFQLWSLHWRNFRPKKDLDDMALAKTLKQTHLDSTTPQHLRQRAHHLPHLDTQFIHSRPDDTTRSSFAYATAGVWNTPQSAHWQQAHAQNNYSPPSAPETGPNTPDACGLLNSYGHRRDTVQPNVKLPPAQTLLSQRQPLDLSTPYTPQFSYYDYGAYCPSNIYKHYPENPYLTCAY